MLAPRPVRPVVVVVVPLLLLPQRFPRGRSPNRPRLQPLLLLLLLPVILPRSRHLPPRGSEQHAALPVVKVVGVRARRREAMLGPAKRSGRRAMSWC